MIKRLCVVFCILPSHQKSEITHKADKNHSSQAKYQVCPKWQNSFAEEVCNLPKAESSNQQEQCDDEIAHAVLLGLRCFRLPVECHNYELLATDP